MMDTVVRSKRNWWFSGLFFVVSGVLAFYGLTVWGEFVWWPEVPSSPTKLYYFVGMLALSAVGFWKISQSVVLTSKEVQVFSIRGLQRFPYTSITSIKTAPNLVGGEFLIIKYKNHIKRETVIIVKYMFSNARELERSIVGRHKAANSSKSFNAKA